MAFMYTMAIFMSVRMAAAPQASCHASGSITSSSAKNTKPTYTKSAAFARSNG